MLDEMLQEYNALEAELQKQRDNLAKTLRPKFHEAFSEFFNRHPGLEEITFTAYTPYFNDGDECLYSVHEPYLTIHEQDDLDSYSIDRIKNLLEFRTTGTVPTKAMDEYNRWGRSYHSTPEQYLKSGVEHLFDLPVNVLQEVAAAVEELPAIEAIISSVPEEVMKSMFDDHARIRIQRDGVEVEEYSHD